MDSVQVIVLCYALFGSRCLHWCAKWIVYSYCMVVHIGLFSSSSDWRRRQEGEMDRVFKSLCCVVHYLVQDDCIGVQNGLFIVIAWWCILDCSVQVQIREGRKKEKWIEFSSHCVVLCTIWFKIIALVCIMYC